MTSNHSVTLPARPHINASVFLFLWHNSSAGANISDLTGGVQYQFLVLPANRAFGEGSQAGRTVAYVGINETVAMKNGWSCKKVGWACFESVSLRELVFKSSQTLISNAEWLQLSPVKPEMWYAVSFLLRILLQWKYMDLLLLGWFTLAAEDCEVVCSTLISCQPSESVLIAFERVWKTPMATLCVWPPQQLHLPSMRDPQGFPGNGIRLMETELWIYRIGCTTTAIGGSLMWSESAVKFEGKFPPFRPAFEWNWFGNGNSRRFFQDRFL